MSQTNPFDSKKTSGGRGLTYEARFCMLFFVRGYTRGKTNYKLAYQVEEASKFDDIVFDDGSAKFEFYQLKHKEDKNRKITPDEFFYKEYNGEFNLIKYVKAYHEVNANTTFKDKIKRAVVLTNIDFELQNDVLNLDQNTIKNAKTRKWCAGISSIKLSAVTITDSIIFDFLNSLNTPKYYQFHNDANTVEILKRQAIDLATKVGPLTENEIRDGLNHVVYAVNTPNDQEIESLIKEELQAHFSLQNVDIIYDKLANLMRNWCDTKESFLGQGQAQPLSLSYADAEEFFNKNVKKFSFPAIVVSSSFTGRTQELELIREKIKDPSTHQSFVISGLGGVGKTELAKKFIDMYGETDYYGRVIWIQAENDESVEKDFKLLANQLKIYDAQIKPLITKVFEYFIECKVLIVFDNFDKSSRNNENLVGHCCKIARDVLKKTHPYFLITSRDRSCLPGVPSLDLLVLPQKDAVALIENRLVIVKEDDAIQLAAALQCFPLALMQATAYVKTQDEINRAVGNHYSIVDYLVEFNKQKEKMLDYAFPDDFGDYEKTTFITWNTSLDAIRTDMTNGPNAIRVINFLAYLYADNIDSRMFLSLFNNDTSITGTAFVLLEKYSMINKIGADSSFYQIHRLVQEVMQLKYKQNEAAVLKEAVHIIDPVLYNLHSHTTKEFDSTQNIPIEKLLHYHSLEPHILKYEELCEKHGEFFKYLHQRMIFSASLNNELDKFEILNISEGDLNIIKQFADLMIALHCNDVLKCIIDRDYFDHHVKYRMLLSSIMNNNLPIFKYLVKNGEFLPGVVKFAPVLMISAAIQGNLDLIMAGLNETSEVNSLIWQEVLFFAVVFNQILIVENLIEKGVNRGVNPQFYFHNKWHPIYAAAKLDNDEILKMLLPETPVYEFKDTMLKIMNALLDDNTFCNVETFGFLFNIFCGYCEDVNEQTVANMLMKYLLDPDVRRFKEEKLPILEFLLDKGAEPILPQNQQEKHYNKLSIDLNNE